MLLIQPIQDIFKQTTLILCISYLSDATVSSLRTEMRSHTLYFLAAL